MNLLLQFNYILLLTIFITLIYVAVILLYSLFLLTRFKKSMGRPN